jgi:hypothetical protein
VINCYLPSNVDLTNAVLRIVKRCSVSGYTFTTISLTETIQLENPMWIVYHNAVNRIIDNLFVDNSIIGYEVDNFYINCGCCENCFCEQGTLKEYLYKRELVNDNGLEYYKYYLES